MHIVERDGSMWERVALQVSDSRRREDIIFSHYLRQHGRLVGQAIGVNILSRDAPWDFEAELSTGETFFLEITAIGDHERQFELDKREERLIGVAGHDQVPAGEIRKLAQLFPDIAALGIAAKAEGITKRTLIENPLKLDGSPHLFSSAIQPPSKPLVDRLAAAIQRKCDKAHQDKDRTVLLLDFRGNFIDPDEVFNAQETLMDLFETAPFPEIWLYVGYYSDDDGNNAEFSFTPLKLPPDVAQRLQQFVARHEVDAEGRLRW